MASFTILQTSDLHGRLTPEGEGRLREMLQDQPGCLLLDSGDACGAGNLGYRPREPSLEALSRLGCRAMVAGNREAHVWRSVMAAKIARASFPVLCSNLTCRFGPSPCSDRLTLLAEDGLRLGLFGLTVPMITRRMFARFLSDLLFEDPTATARKMVAELRAEHDAVILLSHLGLRQDRDLAREVPGIDLILGGHSHVELREPERVGGTWICQPGAHGFWATRVLMTRDGSGWRAEGRLIPLREKPSRGRTEIRAPGGSA